MMQGAVNVGVKTKRELKLLQQICCFTMKARHLTTAMTAVALSVSISLYYYPTGNQEYALAELTHSADHNKAMGKDGMGTLSNRFHMETPP